MMKTEMKWWGWGAPDKNFPMDEKPHLWPWLQKKLDFSEDDQDPPIDFDDIELKSPNQNAEFMESARKLFTADQIRDDKKERLLHSFGKSFPNLLRARNGEFSHPPDLVVYPRSHGEVENLLQLAHLHQVNITPFGGGTNIVGGVDTLKTDRMQVSMDLKQMNRLLRMDPESNLATIEAGATGPKLEQDLSLKGYSLGHAPDSFEYSTLGGWIATRSAGMQSDAYGRIEDMVVSLKMVTPTGTLVTKEVPASSAGPNLNHIALGSEGAFGIITEATMRIHPIPNEKDYRGFLFQDFRSAVSAIHECVQLNSPPSMIRLQDESESELAFQMKSKGSFFKELLQKPVKLYLKKKGFQNPCVLVIGFEGDSSHVEWSKDRALGILKKHGAFALGRSVGSSWSKDKYNIPYLRDYVMDYGCIVDVAETATSWSNVLPLYQNTKRRMEEEFERQGLSGYIGCHISHTYPTGACLYFTFATKRADLNRSTSRKREVKKSLDIYYHYKNLITETILTNGGALTHHHAVGTEHQRWFKDEVSETGLNTLKELKYTFDPKGILNPGKLLPKDSEEEQATNVPSSSVGYSSTSSFESSFSPY